MVLYIAPWVYWIDNPDDTAVRVPKPGSNTPYGMEISCEWLHFRGLNSNAQNVVLACNRGQTIGAKGNFTMIKFSGDGTGSQNNRSQQSSKSTHFHSFKTARSETLPRWYE